MTAQLDNLTLTALIWTAMGSIGAFLAGLTVYFLAINKKKQKSKKERSKR